MKIDPKELINQKQAAEIRGVSPQSINDLVKRGKLRTIRIGDREFLFRSEVEKFKPSLGGRPRKTPAKKAIKRTTHRKKIKLRHL